LKGRFYNIAGCILTIATLFLQSGSVAAQELYIPSRWTEGMYDVSPLYTRDTVKICFLGDVMMHGSQIENAYRGNGTYDFSSYFQYLKPRISSADLAVANMEFPLAGEPYTGYPSFSAPDMIATYLADCGIDVFLAANNHIYDKGGSGAQRTIEKYRELHSTHGVMFLGIAEDSEEIAHNCPLMIGIKGMRLALLNFTYATNGGRRNGWPKVCYMDDRDAIRDGISTAHRKDADMIIAMPHWGNEYELHHSQDQEDTAEWLIEEGVDAVIGTHPHVVQDTETIYRNGKAIPIAYSLGNAVSNMSARNTQIELMITLKAARDTDGILKILEPEYTFLWCSRPGGFNDSYTVIPIRDFIDKEDLWNDIWDYKKMISSYERVKTATGIKDITDTHD
jgi:poly-gamma-glutamate synthesis protein (capsule biosynthesis protein)